MVAIISGLFNTPWIMGLLGGLIGLILCLLTVFGVLGGGQQVELPGIPA